MSVHRKTAKKIAKLNGAIALPPLTILLWPTNVMAQGLPVDTGSHVPVSLWLVGVVILGILLAYGIMHNRKRTSAERQMTEQGTKDVYAREERDRVRSGTN